MHVEAQTRGFAVSWMRRRGRQRGGEPAQRAQVAAPHLAPEEQGPEHRGSHQRRQQEPGREGILGRVEDPLDPDDERETDNGQPRSVTNQPRRRWPVRRSQPFAESGCGRERADRAPDRSDDQEEGEDRRLPQGPDGGVGDSVLPRSMRRPDRARSPPRTRRGSRRAAGGGRCAGEVPGPTACR